MLLSAVSVLVVAQSSSEIPEGLMNDPVLWFSVLKCACPATDVVSVECEHANSFVLPLRIN